MSASAAATLSAIRTVRSFGGEALSFRRFGAQAAAAQGSGLDISRARALLECANRGCIYASLFLLYGVGGAARCHFVHILSTFCPLGRFHHIHLPRYGHSHQKNMRWII